MFITLELNCVTGTKERVIPITMAPSAGSAANKPAAVESSKAAWDSVEENSVWN